VRLGVESVQARGGGCVKPVTCERPGVRGNLRHPVPIVLELVQTPPGAGAAAPRGTEGSVAKSSQNPRGAPQQRAERGAQSRLTNPKRSGPSSPKE